jgi:hypothetical protein
MAIDPTGSGNVTETHVIWHTRKNPSYVPSPVVVERLLSRSFRFGHGDLLESTRR